MNSRLWEMVRDYCDPESPPEVAAEAVRLMRIGLDAELEVKAKEEKKLNLKKDIDELCAKYRKSADDVNKQLM